MKVRIQRRSHSVNPKRLLTRGRQGKEKGISIKETKAGKCKLPGTGKA